MNIKWKNQNEAPYLLDADNLHRMSPSLNAMASPFLVATGVRALLINPHTDIKIVNSNVHKVFESGAAGVALTWADALLDTGSVGNGKDYNLYLCDNANGTADVIASLNSTYPAGYTAESSRKIGGFHTLCATVGTISGHSLTGFVAGDILPNSVWCLSHRPKNRQPEGMVFDPSLRVWVDIYLAAVASGKLSSAYNISFATGATSPAFHPYKFEQWLAPVGKRKPSQQEFVSLSLGSNQGTNIAGSSNPTTGGGHNDTVGRRMISNIGCEDCCGVLWQWGLGEGSEGLAASWGNAYDGNDAGVGGQHYSAPNRPLFGGHWGSGADCGSRGAHWDYGPLSLYSYCGVRGVAEPE